MLQIKFCFSKMTKKKSNQQISNHISAFLFFSKYIHTHLHTHTGTQGPAEVTLA